MLFIKDMKNLKIYTREFFLPTKETEKPANKKTGSAILLLTPNKTSSYKLINHPLAINRQRFLSYYMEKDVTYYIYNKEMKEALEEAYIYDAEYEDVIQEFNIFKNTKDYKYNINNFGKYKVIWITGYSGGGKTTLTSQIIKDNPNVNLERISLDLFSTALNDHYGLPTYRDNLEIYNSLPEPNYIKMFFDSKPPLKPETNVGEAIEMFGKWLEEYAKHHHVHFIVEGIHIGYMNPDFFMDRPLIIVGTSAVNSYFRRHKRDLSDQFDKDSFKAIFASFGLYKNNSKLFDNLTRSMNVASQRRALLKEDVEDYEDIYDYVEEVTNLDNLKGKIKFSGYNKDVIILAQILTPEVYQELMKEYFGITDINKIPVLNISTGAFPTGIDYFTVDSTYSDKPESISIHVPNYMESEDKEGYANRVFNFIIKSIFITFYPHLENTKFPAILADTITDADTFSAELGDCLFGNGVNVGMDIGTFVTCCKNKKYSDIYSILRKKYNNLKMSELVYPEITNETRDYINAFNLQRKFKYASTTKFKAQNSRRRNAIRRLYKSINFSTPLNVPTVNSPNATNTGLASAPPVEEAFTIDNVLSGLIEGQDYEQIGNLLFFNEEATTSYDSTLKRLLYNERIKTSKQILDIDKQVKKDLAPTIKFAYPDLARYGAKNVFIDLYYYNEIFFRNNTYQQKKGYELYLTLLNRLINDPRIKAAGYTKKTIFIPILDWDHSKDTRMFMYREDINPISIIYELMNKDNNRLTKVFGKTDIIFFAKDKYFKLNFSEIKPDEMKKMTLKFRMFISKIENNEVFDSEDQDTSTTSTPEAVKAEIYDKIEDKKGVDLTPVEAVKGINPRQVGNTATIQKKEADEVAKVVEKKKEDPNTSKGLDTTEEKKRAERIQKLVQAVDDAIEDEFENNQEADADDVIDRMNTADIASLLSDIDSNAPGGVNMDATRAARVNNLTDQFMNKEIKGRTVKEILSEAPPTTQKLETKKLDIDSPFDDWSEMTYMNLDKNYDLDRDIVAAFEHFTHVSYPIFIRNIKVEDTSTSEDRINTYSVDCEDYKGKRFNIKLDIPIIVDNRFLLRGSNKVISSQFFNMPILKTDLDAAQINTNYQKIFIYTYRNNTGCSSPISSILIKALQKYKGTILKIKPGDNTRVSNKYQLPIDYIDLSTVFDTIEVKNKDNHIKIYFNQDLIRQEHPEVAKMPDDELCYGWDLNNNQPIIYKDMTSFPFAQVLYDYLYIADPKFAEVAKTCKASIRGTYSQCSIMSTRMPLIVVAAFHSGINNVLKKAGIEYKWTEKLDPNDRAAINMDYIRFNDGYLVYRVNYVSAMLLNGLKDCPTDAYSIGDMDNRMTYIEFMSNFGGRIKADGLENFYDCLIDPITKEILEYYKLPTDFLGVLLYANALMVDNKYVKHTDTSSRRVRRAEMVAAYTYSVLADAYGKWATPIRNGREGEPFFVKRTAVIDELMASPITQESSVNNALGAVEETNTVTFKGKSGLNSVRAYSLDKRTYDESMINVLGQSTGFSGNVGISRVATMNMNVEGVRGFIKQSYSDTSAMNTANSLTATESMIPFETTSDDSGRISMSYVQTAKHAVRTNKSDPPLVTSGSEQAIPYLTTDTFAFKAKEDGKILEITDQYILVEYKSGAHDYINLQKTIEHNSDGGYYVPMQLIASKGLRNGSIIQSGQILAYDPLSFTSGSLGESDKLSYMTGVLSKVAIISSDDGFEDSGVCTEKLSEELTTQVIYQFGHVIEKDAVIYKLAKIGDYVNVGDPLIIWQDAFEEEDATALLKYVNTDSNNISTIGRRTVLSETTGRVADIKIYRTCEIEDMSESLQKIVKAYEKPIKELKKKLEDAGMDTKMLPATYALEPHGKLKKAQDALIIEVYVEHDDIVGVGDKIVYLAANKAVIKTVIPKGKEPYTDFRPDEEISALLSVSSINHRMVTSIIKNGIINKLMIELDRSVKDMAGIKYDVKDL